MNRVYYWAMILCCIVLSQNALSLDRFENLSITKQRLTQYHDSGQYYTDIAAVASRALAYLRFRINQNKEAKNSKPLAIVFDIDETSLSNYKDMKALDFGGKQSDYLKAEERGDDPVIPPMLTLYQYAINNKVTVFFVTGRTERQRKMTTKNLIAAGYKHWKQLYLKPNTYNKKSVVAYKSSTRKAIEKQGYDIVLNIGDQLSDLQGGFADMAFKVPDPYYLIS